MRRRFSVTLNKLLWIILGVFVIGIPAYFGTGGLRGGGRQNRPGAEQSPDVIAVVNGDKMTRAVLDDAFVRQWQLLSYGKTPPHLPLQQITDVRLQGFDKAVDRMLQMQEVRRRKIKASEREITARINQQVDQQIETIRNRAKEQGRKMSDVMKDIMASYGDRVNSVTEAEFKTWFRKWMRQKDRLAAIEEEIVLKELENRVGANVNPTWKDLEQSYDQIKLQEIQFQVKSELDAPDLRTYGKKEETEAKAKEVAAEARRGADFTELVMKYTSNPMATSGPGGDESQATQGKTPWMTIDDPYQFRTRYSRQFAQEARKYKEGDIVGPVWSKNMRSYFVFKVLGRRNQPPENLNDPAKHDEYLTNFRDRRRRDAFRDFKEELRDKAKIEISDPEVEAEQARRDREYTKSAELFKKALGYLGPWYTQLPRNATPPLQAVVPGAVYYTLGEMQQQLQHFKKARDEYESGLGFLSHDKLSLADMYLGLAYNEWQWMTSLEQGAEKEQHKQETGRWLEAMLNVAPDDVTVHENALWLYTALGAGEICAEQRLWLVARYEAEGPDQNKSKAIEHLEKLVEYYKNQGEQAKADEQQKRMDELKKELAEAAPAAPSGGLPGGVTVTPAP